MKRIAFLVMVGLISMLNLNAQEYQTALGVRGGFYNGLSIKHFVSSANAVEGVIATHYRGLMIAGMYQMHAPAFEAPGLYWYYGGGAHLGFYDRNYSPWYNNETGNFSVLGLMGVVGLEYKIEEIPITIGVDVAPAFNIIGHTGFWINSGIALRYTFN